MNQRNNSHFLLVFSEKITVGSEFLIGDELEVVVAKGIGTTTTRRITSSGIDHRLRYYCGFYQASWLLFGREKSLQHNNN